jgi:flagellar motor switch protein FliN/FliY
VSEIMNSADPVDYVPFEATVGPGDAGAGPAVPAPGALERLHDVPVELAVEIGRTRMTIGKPIARGEVVVIDEEFGLRVTEVVSDSGRTSAGGSFPDA